MIKSKAIGMIFANMHDEGGGALTKLRSMASLPFAGRYRLIDFVLSSFTNCGIQEVVIVTKANYRSLMDHVGSGRAWDLSRKNQGLTIAPPFAAGGSRIYHGKVEALSNALTYIKNSSAEYIVLSDCNWVCNLSTEAMLSQHIKTGADVTMACCEYTVNAQIAANSVTVKTDGDRITDFLIDLPAAGNEKRLTGMNVFVMNRSLLSKLVEEAMSRGCFSFERDILGENLARLDARVFLHEGYAKQIYNLQSYYNISMELLDPAVTAAMFTRSYPVNTKVRDDAPVRYGHESRVTRSLVADGCTIEGTVENSVLFRGVRVGRGAVVRNSILMQDTVVEEGVRLDYVVTDKNVTVRSELIMNGVESYPVYIEKGSVLE